MKALLIFFLPVTAATASLRGHGEQGERSLTSSLASGIKLCSTYCVHEAWEVYRAKCFEHCDCAYIGDERATCKEECRNEKEAGIDACKAMCRGLLGIDSGGGEVDSGEGEVDSDGEVDSGEGEPDSSEGEPDSGEGEPDSGEGEPDSGEGEPDSGEGDLVLWNKLGSLEEFANSEVGPGAVVVGSYDVSFVPGKDGNGFTSGQGWGKSGPNFGPWEAINPDYHLAGTVEFWWKPPRRYDEPHSSPDEIFVKSNWAHDFPVPLWFMYRWREHNGIGGFQFGLKVQAGINRDFRTGKVAPFQAGEWTHVAFVWDMNGLPNDPDVWYGVFVNNVYYPLTDVNNPGASINIPMRRPNGAYFAMAYYDADWNNQQNGVLDEVRVWRNAKMNFTDVR